MFSSGAARAFLVASLCSSVLSLPHLSARNVKRSLKDYSNNLVYTNPQVDALYIAIEVDGQTYGVSLDNNWGGLIIGSNSKYSSTQQVTIEGVSVAASSTHGSVSIFEEEIQIDYYCAAQWPTTWSSLDSSGGIYNGKIGWDITNSKSAINQYLAGTTQGNQNAWYYDLLQIWNWQANSTSTSEIEFEGIISVSETLSWDAIGISASDVAKYSLPDLSDINTSPAISVRSDGRFCLDTTHWIGGSPVTVTSQVPSWSQGTIAGILDLTLRWSIMPTAIVEGLYGSLSGAKSYQYSNYKYWEIPCDSHLSALILSIDGHNYYIDATALVVPNPWGEQCIGSVFSGGSGSGSSVTYDVVIGFELLAQFYFRAGIDSSNQPYYKMMDIGSPSWAYGGLSGSASAAAPWPSGTGYTSNYGSGSGYQSSGSGYQGSGSGSSYGNNNWKTSTSSTWSPATTSNTQYGNGGYQGSGYQGSGGNTYNNGYQGTTTTYKTYATSSSMTYVASSRPTYAAGASTYGGAGTSSPNGWYYGGQQASSTYGAAQSSSTGYAGSGSGSQWGSGSGSSGSGYGSSGSSSGSSGSGSGSYSGSGSGSESGSGSGSGYYGSGSGSQGGSGNEGYFSRTVTSTVLYTSTREHFTTTTIAVYPSGTNYYGSGSGSGSGTNYGSGSGYSGSGSGYSGSGSGYSGSGYDSENLAVAGNAAETDDQGNDLNLPHGSIADQLKHCLPAIIVIVVLAAVGALASIIVCLVRRRRGNGGARPSAYRNLHEADNHAPVHVPLYGAEEGTSRYADPYSDKQ